MSKESDYNVISFVAHNAAQVEVHRHHCFQIVASISGTFACSIGGDSFARMRGFVVNQNVPHSCRAESASVIVSFIDAESYAGWQLKEMLGGKPYLDIAAIFTEAESGKICADGNAALPKLELKKLAAKIFDIVLPGGGQPDKNLSDERITGALSFIETNLSQTIHLEDIAAKMFLSPERARRLFAQATGSPFSQYLLWKRIKAVIIAALTENLSLTDAAHRFGFADSAHFTRTFKKTFGMSPKTHLKNNRFVQFLNPLV